MLTDRGTTIARVASRDGASTNDPIAEAARLWSEHGWAQAAPGMSAITSLMRAHQLVLARVEAELKPLRISFARYEVLMLLLFSRRGSLPMRTVGERLQVHQTSVTNAVDRLEAAGLVERRPHPTDRRATLVHLTDEGRDTALQATKALNATVFTDPGLRPSSVTTLVRVLTELRRGAGDF
jgi:DNA-binding MarR family transcriptional regulator